MKKILSLRHFLIAHLIIVVAGCGLFSIHNKLVDMFITRYSSWTGGGFGYSFFSPDVGNQTVVKTYTLIGNKEVKEDVFGTGDDIADSRISSVIHTLRNQRAYELLSRMLVAYMFEKYPGSQSVYISIGEFVPPSAEQYRLYKKKDEFRELYNGTFIYEPSPQEKL